MKKINAAYAALSDPRKRADYDAGRASQGVWEQERRQRQEEDRRQERQQQEAERRRWEEQRKREE